jgi:endonuclease YncB( thermonuclease family)
VLPACAQPIQRYDRTNVLANLDKPDVGLVLGSFPLTKVIDGDTIRVDGLDASMRLLGLDTEETFKYKSEWRDFDKGWARYLADAQAKTKHPVKIPTPMGEEAKKFAQKFFKGVRFVELERDHPKEIRDFYNRYLTYVFVEKDGKRINYNVECVRAGMSPYFSKYGYSRRFHAEFVAAQDEARKAQRGIWDPAKQHYPDYDRRLEWWDRRGDYIQAFERDAEGKNWVVLTHWDAMDRLRDLLGREVVVLGAVGDIRTSTTGPTKVMLSRRRTASFPLIFFDKQILAESKRRGRQGRVHPRPRRRRQVPQQVHRPRRAPDRRHDPRPGRDRGPLADRARRPRHRRARPEPPARPTPRRRPPPIPRASACPHAPTLRPRPPTHPELARCHRPPLPPP